ncbi:hypothetical protein HPB50_022781 [Hyalomma asiaticum]|uniref:Uncharacterized protein n=1 Tax=Hyalomma asiaticum TaxID=266040 RepID=A0ACB7TPB4_HYAAI|nr:hypothetical protein HPB50_022781 [Hyalomma asiaticum]
MSVVYRCTQYKGSLDACTNCRRPGHRHDVCPHPKSGLCSWCGDKHDRQDLPSCIPSCTLCAGQYLMGTGSCKPNDLKEKVPYKGALSPAPLNQPISHDIILQGPSDGQHNLARLGNEGSLRRAPLEKRRPDESPAQPTDMEANFQGLTQNWKRSSQSALRSKSAAKLPASNTLLATGDFNCAHVDWGYRRKSYRGMSTAHSCEGSVAASMERNDLSLRSLQNELPPGFPRHCTQTNERSCDVLDCLPALNEALNTIGAEVCEVAFKKIAICNTDRLVRLGNIDPLAIVRGSEALRALLSNHACVTAVDVTVLDKLPWPIFQAILWTNLHSASGITRLELVKCLPQTPLIFSFINAICLLLKRELIQLTLHDIYLEGTTKQLHNNLREAFRSTRTLRSLSIRHVGYCTRLEGKNEEDTRIDQAILDGVADNTSLVSLSTAFTYPQGDCIMALKRLLENTTSLTSLTITHLAMHHRAFQVKEIIGAVAANRTLRSFALKDLNLNPLENDSLVELLTCNSTLKYVRFHIRQRHIGESSTAQLQQIPTLHMDTLVKTLKEAKFLEWVVLNCSFWLDDIRRLAEAVYSKTLRIKLAEITMDDPEIFHGYLNGVPGSHNIVFGRCIFPRGAFPPIIPVVEHIPAKKPLFFCTIRDISLHDLCRVLGGDDGDSITSLKLCAYANLCPETRRDLTLYLESTRKLRKLHLTIKNDPETMTAVIRSLAHNSSIEDLYISAPCEIDETSVEVFSGWLSTNKRLHSLEVSIHYRSRYLFVRALAMSLQENYALSSIYVGSVQTPHYEHLRKLTWRNQVLLHRAAGFVLGCTDMRAAKAYGLLAQHPQLPEAVKKCGLISDEELRRRLLAAECCRRSEFWRHAAIVTGELVCNERECEGDRKTQLDQIGPYMLDHICSFLTLGDILSEKDEILSWPGRYTEPSTDEIFDKALGEQGSNFQNE